MISGFITVRPMKPQTTEGIAASSSMTIFSVSFDARPQNSETKTAAPSPNGTAMSIASPVTLTVPTISASDAVADVVHRGRIPLGAEQELAGS